MKTNQPKSITMNTNEKKIVLTIADHLNKHKAIVGLFNLLHIQRELLDEIPYLMNTMMTPEDRTFAIEWLHIIVDNAYIVAPLDTWNSVIDQFHSDMKTKTVKF